MKAAEILQTAAGIVGGARANTHGPVAVNHSKIATMWNAYLAIRQEPAAPLDAHDAALMMALLKIARTQLGAYNPDDGIDHVGYAACAAEIAAGMEAER